MVTITLKGREIPLLFTTWEMKQIQEEIGPLSSAISIILGRNREDETDTSLYGGSAQLEAIGKAIKIMGNAGLEEAGQDADMTEKWIMRALKPSEMIDMVNKIMDAFNDGMVSEIPVKQAEGPVDAGLEEMERKKKRQQPDVPDGRQLGTDRRAPGG